MLCAVCPAECVLFLVLHPTFGPVYANYRRSLSMNADSTFLGGGRQNNNSFRTQPYFVSERFYMSALVFPCVTSKRCSERI